MGGQARELPPLLALGQGMIAEERYQEAIDHFSALADRYPDNPSVIFQLAGAYDAAGREEEAVAPYRAALLAGLSDEESVMARIQLASTLRNLGRFEEAVAILSRLCEEHPDHREARAFLALALTSDGHAESAVAELLDLLLTNPGPIASYRRSLRWYADDLRSGSE